MQAQLPPRFQPHPECAAGVLTLDQAAMMIWMGWLTHEGAQFVFPPSAWPLLPQPEQPPAQVKRSQRRGWLDWLRFGLDLTPKHQMTERELATVLTALRYWQAALPKGIAVYDDIATDGGRFEPLSINEIDELCMNLSCGKPS
jgi:hypothetical protein